MKNSESFEYMKIEIIHMTKKHGKQCCNISDNWRRISNWNIAPTFTNQKSVKYKRTKDVNVLLPENGQ